MLPIDTTAAQSSNQILQESIAVSSNTFANGGLLFLKNAPFFGKDFTAKWVDPQGVVHSLTKDKDYIFVAQWHGVTQTLGGLWGAVYLVNKAITGNVVVDYRSLGGNLTIDQNSFITLFSSLTAAWMVSKTVLAVSPIMRMAPLDFKLLPTYEMQYSSVLLSVEINLGQTTNVPGTAAISVEQMTLDLAKQALQLAQTALQSIPIASQNVLGGVKKGRGVDIAADGTLSTIIEFQGNTTNYVSSINGRKGDVNINVGDVGGLGSSSVYPAEYFATASQGALALTALQVAPVVSVNGQVGEVVLSVDNIFGLGGAAKSDVAAFATSLDGEIARSAYQKPSEGIPLTDLSSAIQLSLNKADQSLQVVPVQSVNGKTGVIVLKASDLDGIGEAAFKPLSYFATADQGKKADTAYQKPQYGITFEDLSNEIQIAFALAMSAMQTIQPATPTNLGAVKLAGDLGGTAEVPTVPGLGGKQDLLISGQTIKTVGGKGLMGQGDVGLTPQDIGAATAAQGRLAQTALQAVTWQDLQGSIDRSDLRTYIVSIIMETLVSTHLLTSGS